MNSIDTGYHSVSKTDKLNYSLNIKPYFGYSKLYLTYKQGEKKGKTFFFGMILLLIYILYHTY
jgi:hypothetical protein